MTHKYQNDGTGRDAYVNNANSVASMTGKLAQRMSSEQRKDYDFWNWEKKSKTTADMKAFPGNGQFSVSRMYTSPLYDGSRSSSKSPSVGQNGMSPVLLPRSNPNSASPGSNTDHGTHFSSANPSLGGVPTISTPSSVSPYRQEGIALEMIPPHQLPQKKSWEASQKIQNRFDLDSILEKEFASSPNPHAANASGAISPTAVRRDAKGNARPLSMSMGSSPQSQNRPQSDAGKSPIRLGQPIISTGASHVVGDSGTRSPPPPQQYPALISSQIFESSAHRMMRTGLFPVENNAACPVLPRLVKPAAGKSTNIQVV